MIDNLDIQVGDLVKVINKGNTYSSYTKMAEKLKVLNWSKNVPPINGTIAKVIKMYVSKKDILSLECYVYIEEFETGKGHIIGIRGIEKVNEFIKKSEMILR